jgi:hypothetical protein
MQIQDVSRAKLLLTELLSACDPRWRTMITQHAEWAETCWLTDPNSSPVKPPCPRDPITNRSASRDRSMSTLAALPSLIWVFRWLGGFRLNTSRTARSSMALACSSRLASAPHGIRRTWDRSSAAEASRPQPPEDQHCWRWLLRWRSANWLCSEPSYSDHNSFPYRTWQRGRRRLWLGGRLAAPGCPPARRHHAGGGIRWRPRRGCCAPPGSSVG